ncbi:EamA family transporter [Rhodobacteraceae bacterium 2CG4]|uniref:EamA family transporter n=1 Tax=Halovulum marinum TaxID=2662447 RepID=A0A6L5Z254_9RHOB|nr:EamA family transporter [Halovulum marinum]MSU90588.1 EamA family transporter [Halovulum marinum]
MSRSTDLLLTALAPAVWGSTYYVTTEFLPPRYPVTVAALRALPAGLLLLALTRHLPPRDWLGRVFLLGALNFPVFWCLLFVAAYRLPGGVAATLGSLQALLVILLARGLLGAPVRAGAVLAALAGMAGVAALVLGPEAALDPLGLAAGIGGAASMALGTVLSRKWRPSVPPLTFTAWRLIAGGLLLLPMALLLEPPLPPQSGANLVGLLWLGLVGAAATYGLWFRGIGRIEPSAVSMPGMMSPVTAVLPGWILLGEALTLVQGAGATAILLSVWAGQRAAHAPAALRTRAPGTGGAAPAGT